MTDCCDVLPASFPAGLGCNAIPAINEAITSIADYLCSIACETAQIRVTDNCDTGTFDDLFLSDCCLEVPCGSIVVCIVANVIESVHIYDCDSWELFSIAADFEFRVGESGNFADFNNPLVAELNALFGGTPSTDALVYIEQSSIFWYTKDGGTAWQQAGGTGQKATQIPASSGGGLTTGSTGAAFYTFYNGNIYTNGSAGNTPLPIQAGDEIRIDFDYGYNIQTFATGVDAATFRLLFTGPITISHGGGASGFGAGGMSFRNGAHLHFGATYIATASGNLNLLAAIRVNGDGGSGWVFNPYLARPSVLVRR
jgi:hypothetical protein